MEKRSEEFKEVIYQFDGTNKTALTLTTGNKYIIKLKTCKTSFLGCCKIPGVTFETNKSFIRPEVVDHLKSLENLAKKSKNGKFIVFGHTDKVGKDFYNKKLSERRALSAYAFITDNAEEWEKLYKAEKWGVKVIQIILKDFGGPYDPGPVNGKLTKKTKKAIKQYQKDHGLPENGIADAATRKSMFTKYMTGKHDIKITVNEFMSMPYQGCGEFNPLIETIKSSEQNRRVTFYLFHKDRLPELPCKLGDIGPCQTKMKESGPRHKDTFRCSFYDFIAKDCSCENIIGEHSISILIKDLSGNPLKETSYDFTINGTTHTNKTTVEGILEEKIPEGVTEAELNIYAWNVKLSIENIPPVTDIKGAKARLNNLGFYSEDPVDANNTESFKQALMRFQTFYNLEITSELDQSTQKKLEEIYGS